MGCPSVFQLPDAIGTSENCRVQRTDLGVIPCPTPRNCLNFRESYTGMVLRAIAQIASAPNASRQKLEGSGAAAAKAAEVADRMPGSVSAAWRTRFCVPRRNSADARPFAKTGAEKVSTRHVENVRHVNSQAFPERQDRTRRKEK